MRRISGFLIALLFTLNLSACSQSLGKTGKEYTSDNISTGVISANSEFAFNIFKSLNMEDSDRSIFISPLSISTALTMTYNGAESTTKKAMEDALGYKKIDRAAVNQSYSKLLNQLEKIDKKVELNIANSIWIREGEAIKHNFISINRSSFDAEIRTLDFSKDTAAGTINSWISDATKEKIDKMVDSPIDPSVVMYLINAIFFKGEWSKQFDTKNTREQAFKTFAGQEQLVSMMSRKGKVEYVKGDDYKAVRLPYGKGNTSMYCILPNEGININEFIKGINANKWNDIIKGMSEIDDVVLEIPKFKLEYGIKELNSSLDSLGMGEAFSSRADFSGIREDVKISSVLHKAVIEVNEEGSEAAAVTAVEVNLTSYTEPVTFTADRPFVFIIADDTTGTILFMGKLLNID